MTGSDESSTSSSAIVIVGAGGHARVVIDSLRASGHPIHGLLDNDAALHGSQLDGVPVIGSVSELEQLTGPVVIAIGNNRIRADLASRYDNELLTVRHPSAIVSPAATIESGCHLLAGSVVQPGAVLGSQTIINTGASVDHDCTLGPACHVAPGARLAGNVTLGARVFCGIGSVVVPGVTVGDDAVIGAGAVVVRDVEAGTTVIGCPAKPRGT